MERFQPVPLEQSQEFERFNKDIQFFQDNAEPIAQVFPDEYVAIYNQAVIAHNPNVRTLIADLKDIPGNMVGRALIKQSTPNKIVLIL